MRNVKVEIHGGLTRRRNHLSLSEVARHYPCSIEWVRLVERSDTASARVARRYRHGLLQAIDQRRDALAATLLGLASLRKRRSS
jgi:hypothetical protein